jgi:hypothetical protein
MEAGWRMLLRRRQLAVAMAGIAVFLSGFLVLWSLESIFYLSATFKTIVLALGGIAGIVSAVFISRHLGKPQFRRYYADVSKSANNEALRNVLDLHLEPVNENLFVHHAIEQNLRSCDDASLVSQQTAYEQNHPVYLGYRKSGYASGVLFLLLLIATLFQSSGVLRTLQFWKTFQPPIPFTYVISPGNVVLEQGTGFQARIQFEGELKPRNVAIGLKTTIESDYRLQQMTSIDGSTYVSEPFSFTNTTEYFIQMDRYKSETFKVEIQLLPRFEDLSVVMTPPPHTGIEPSRQAYPFSVIEAYPGTRIQISALANKLLQQVELMRTSTGEAVRMEADPEGRYAFMMVSSGADTLSFRLTDGIGFENRNPFTFVISPLIDTYPSVLLLEPQSEINLLNPEVIQMGYEYRDDFGFSRLRVKYQIKKAFGPPIEGVVNLSTPRDRSGLGISNLDLTSIGVQPLDEVTYWLELFDNDAIAGYKMSESQRQRITLTSMADYLDIVDEKERKVENELRNMDEKYREFEKLMENFQEDLKTNQLDEFSQQQMLEELQERQEKVNEASRQLKDEFEQLRNELNQNQILSPETMEQYQQLQKLIEEIDSPELREALRQMQESLQNMDQNALREAMRNLEFNEELYKQRLERTLELFRQVKTTAEMDKLAKNYEDLARRQEELSKQGAGEQQRQQQEALQKELDQTEQKLDSLDKDAPKNAQDALEKLKQELQKDRENASDQMKDILDQMKQQNGGAQQQQNQDQDQSPVQQQQQDAGEQLQQMSQKVRQSMASMSQQQNTVNANALRSILRTLLLLSETQEDITLKTAQQPFRGNGFVELARRENNVNQTFGTTVDSLLAVASRVPQLSNMILEKKTQVQKNLDNSLRFLAERDNGNASAETRFVLSGINELGTLIANLLDQMENQNNGGSGGSGSMMQQLQEMGGQQQQLNQMIQDMINDIQGERLGQDQMERLNQMARQQNAIRRQLEEMRRSGGLPEGDRIMSELERVAQEMEDAINDLRGGRMDRQFINRQQNILSRMLDAEKALQERDEDEKRKGNTGDQNLRALPPELTLEELRKRIRSRLSDPNMSKFSDDYQKLIEKYFEVLERRDR